MTESYGRDLHVGSLLLGRAADYFGLDSIEDLQSPSRNQQIVWARWAVILILLDERPCSERWLSRFMNLHHSTVQHAYRRAKELRRESPLFFEAVEQLRSEVVG